jgi:N-acetylneuraminic acid mutarotase
MQLTVHRLLTACAAVQHKIFCYGGRDKSENIVSDTWSLDTSNNFALSTPTWTNVTHKNNFVTTPTALGIAVALNDGVSFLINGGLSTPANISETNQTTVFNTATNTWTAINSTASTQTYEHAAIVDSTGKIWLWGGTRYC